jgi:hypothetical protein
LQGSWRCKYITAQLFGFLTKVECGGSMASLAVRTA